MPPSRVTYPYFDIVDALVLFSTVAYRTDLHDTSNLIELFTASQCPRFDQVQIG
ncbi:hypothetical protein Plhal304r1_c057g0142611 [Plasmopara halstedii]